MFVRRSGLRDFLWQHFEDNLADYNGSIIFQYRNPLDALVSRYHYDHDRWQAAGRDVNSPMDCLFAVEEFAQKFARMRRIGQKRPKTLMVTYENLKRAPCEVFETMVGFVGVPINRKLIERAVAFSDITVIRKEEEERGRAIVAPTTEGVFTRDGSIGQWKSYFSPADVNRIEDILSKHEISLDEFNLG